MKTMVLQILKDYPRARDSDAWLTIKLWCVYFPSKIQSIWVDDPDPKNETGRKERKYIFLDDILDLPKEDQVKRVRAIIQNQENLYLPTSWEVAKQRDINEAVWRNYTNH